MYNIHLNHLRKLNAVPKVKFIFFSVESFHTKIFILASTYIIIAVFNSEKTARQRKKKSSSTLIWICSITHNLKD